MKASHRGAATLTRVATTATPATSRAVGLGEIDITDTYLDR